uniref:Polynucleotide adenylyltransferase n=1 Tax=Caenorhabditis japonica TaxID=281687 RepID=A0A8R1HNA8_CAEJA
MDEESSLSTTQPQTSFATSKTSEDVSKTPADAEKKEPQPQEPSTSQNCKREFGYEDAIPFAPWRRKRYALTVQGLHEEIVDMYHWIKPNEIESRLRVKVFEKVRDSVLKRWMPHKKIKISMFGSLRTNLFLPTSDIDVLVECEDWAGQAGDPNETQKWLHETARGLEEDDIAESVMVYGGAFVPIVKMVDRDTRLSIDISFNTVQGVRAASYIAKVKEEFPLIEPLVLLLKQFLHYRNLNQTFTGGLSSYGLVLLLVNFFQLNALNMRHRTIYDRGVNLGYLLLRFLELYSLEFNYEEMGISAGQACYIPKSANGARYGVKRAQPGNLALEDPLLTANDVGRSTYNFSSIANAFGQALQILMVAVTLRERKGRNELTTKVYKGSLLHLIMPFTAKELTYRNWLMSGVITYSRHNTSASYDLNLLHNTLVSPTVDLSRYGWLRRIPPGGYDKRDSRPLKIVNPADDVRNQVIEQLRLKILEEEGATGKTAAPAASKPLAASALPDLGLSGPPLPISTASVNTSATVSTAASVSEREDTDSPGLGSSLGTPSSEDDEDGATSNRNAVTSAVQFKKPFSEVVASKTAAATSQNNKDNSKRTQTNFQNGYPRNQGYIDYAAAAGSNSMNYNGNYYNNQQKYRPSHQQCTLTCQHQYQQQRPRHSHYHRNHSQGSDGSEGQQRHQHQQHQHQHQQQQQQHNRWPANNNNNNNHTMSQRGRRARGNSASSRGSRHSSDSRSRPRGGYPAYVIRPQLQPTAATATAAEANKSVDSNSTLTGASSNLDDKDATLTPDGCSEPPAPRKYADAVKKKSSVGSMDVANGNVKSPPVSPPAPPALKERSWNVIAANLAKTNMSSPPQAPPAIPQHRNNECGLDTKSTTSSTTPGPSSSAHHSSEIVHHQPQLFPPANRLQR